MSARALGISWNWARRSRFSWTRRSMAASRVKPPGGPMSSAPAGTSSRPEGEPSVNGATRGTANPGPGGIANPGPGSEMLEGTRGAEGPGRPPRKVPRSDGAPPRVPPEPGKGPRLVEPRTRVVSRGSIIGFWATTAGTSRPKAIKIPGPHPATRRIMDPAPLPGNGSADACQAHDGTPRPSSGAPRRIIGKIGRDRFKLRSKPASTAGGASEILGEREPWKGETDRRPP
jgi:hypothetical protein